MFRRRRAWGGEALADRDGLVLDAGVVFLIGTMAAASIRAAMTVAMGGSPQDRLHVTILAVMGVAIAAASVHLIAKLVQGQGTLRQSMAAILTIGGTVVPTLDVLETLTGPVPKGDSFDAGAAAALA